MEENKNAAVFTEEETARLEETYAFRKKMVEFAFRGEKVPDSAKDIEAINGVLNSMDSAIYNAANARLKHQDTQNKEEALNAIAELLKSITDDATALADPNRSLELPEDLPLDLVPGEAEIGRLDLKLEDVLNQEV